LALKAADGLDIPYVGYLELDIQVLGRTFPGRGVLVVKDAPHTLGMHVTLGLAH